MLLFWVLMGSIYTTTAISAVVYYRMYCIIPPQERVYPLSQRNDDDQEEIIPVPVL
jgi:hypothetical protein